MAVTAAKNSEIQRLRRLRKRKAWREIIEQGERMLAQPDTGAGITLHSLLGKAYLEVRQHDAARKVLTQAQRKQPRNSLVLRRLGELECAVGNYERAVEHWEALRNKKGKSADRSTYLNLTRALRKVGRLQAAELVAREGQTLLPNNGQLRNELQRITSMLDDERITLDNCTVTSSRTRQHPYRDLRSRNYWNKTVACQNALEIDNWYTKKFSISGLSISSAGSCFAQHIGKALRENGYEYVDVEPAPNFLRVESQHHDYGYGIYSARFGNVYTSRQLVQLLQRSLQLFHPTDSLWEKDGGYVDAFRPTIEPDPLASPDEVLDSRHDHLAAVHRMFKLSDVFIFTFGLTETWTSNEDGAVYPVAPGVSGGTYDETRYSFKNLSYTEVLDDMEEFLRLARGINKSLKVILTVSPVPLMATASSNNVVVASSYSKSVLRAVAGYLCEKHDFVDYFPSYEIVGSHIMRGQFFNPDGRTVSQYGVSHVMKQFFAEHVPPAAPLKAESEGIDPDDIVCDEELLDEFGPS